MIDIVGRLRDGADWCARQADDALMHEAADEIKRLRMHNAELMTILREIASLRHSNASAAAMAQSALDTIQALDNGQATAPTQ